MHALVRVHFDISQAAHSRRGRSRAVNPPLSRRRAPVAVETDTLGPVQDYF